MWLTHLINFGGEPGRRLIHEPPPAIGLPGRVSVEGVLIAMHGTLTALHMLRRPRPLLTRILMRVLARS